MALVVKKEASVCLVISRQRLFSLLLVAVSIVNCMDGWQSFGVDRKAVAAGKFGIIAKVSSTYLR